MPEGTAVDRTYKALLKEGHSEESAARIAQAQTGEALATGKPPKHENCEIENAFSKWQIDFLRKEFDPINRPLNNMEIEKVRNLCMRAKIEDCKAIAEAGIKNISDIAKSVLQQRKYMGNTSFQNGRIRALNHIMNRAERVGIKLQNAGDARKTIDKAMYKINQWSNWYSPEDIKKMIPGYAKIREDLEPMIQELQALKTRSPHDSSAKESAINGLKKLIQKFEAIK